ncbi:MAG TPA: FkbM family methyltransferase [Pyrinomonadaceae bacterium]|jgi:FkbM family methyltransferase
MVSTSLARAILRSRLRGATRLTIILARRFSSLQAIPLQTRTGTTLYADLRLLSTHNLFLNRQWPVYGEKAIRRAIKTGDVVFDIGAHVGVYTTLFSHLVGQQGKVHAFEPNPEVLPALRRTVEGLGNVVLHPFALSNETRKAVLVVPGDPSMASLSDWFDGAHGDTHTVDCEIRRMDDLIDSGALPQPDFIKCDVEGAETLVFKGGEKSLNRAHAPIILFEGIADSAQGFGESSSGAIDFLLGLEKPRYHCFRLGAKGKLTAIKALDVPYANLLVVPDSKIDEWQDD